MGNLLIYSAAEIFCIWPRSLPRCWPYRGSRRRKPRRGRCALRARGDRKCKTPPRSNIYRGGVLFRMSGFPRTAWHCASCGSYSGPRAGSRSSISRQSQARHRQATCKPAVLRYALGPTDRGRTCDTEPAPSVAFPQSLLTEARQRLCGGAWVI
jgi:hypothetical protein